MDLTNLKIKLGHTRTKIDECEDNVPCYDEEELDVCEVCLLRDEEMKEYYENVATLNTHSLTSDIDDEELNLCIIANTKGSSAFFEDLNDDFCLDIGIYDGDNKIGNVSFNRLFVEAAQDIGIWLDNEAPNSMKIGTHICKNDFNVVEGRYVGIIDELTLDKKYIKEGWADCAIYMIYSLILAWGFKIYYLYTQPKSSAREEYMEDVIATSNLKTYLSLGFEIVNNYESILRKDMWHETKNRLEFDDGMEEIYLP